MRAIITFSLIWYFKLTQSPKKRLGARRQHIMYPVGKAWSWANVLQCLESRQWDPYYLSTRHSALFCWDFWSIPWRRARSPSRPIWSLCAPFQTQTWPFPNCSSIFNYLVKFISVRVEDIEINEYKPEPLSTSLTYVHICGEKHSVISKMNKATVLFGQTISIHQLLSLNLHRNPLMSSRRIKLF